MDLKKICLEVTEVCKEAGKFIKQESLNFDRSKIEIKGLNDLVSYVDKEAEKILVNKLRQILPEAGFITEEGTTGTTADKKDLSWIIDPLDGTTNFLHNIPIYSVSVGLMEQGKIILGVVYEVGKDECFYAWKNGGAYLNGNKIQVSPIEKLSEGLIITGFPYYDFGRQNDYMTIFAEFMKQSHGVRRLGSAATDMVYIACGRGEGFFEYNLKPWDIAGGIIIVQEAGGVVTDFKGGDNFLFGGEMLAAGKVHGEMQQLIYKNWYK